MPAAKRVVKKRKGERGRRGYRKPNARRQALMLRLNETERALLASLAKVRGLSMAEVVRERVFVSFDTRKGGMCPTCGAGWLALDAKRTDVDEVPF